MPSLQIGFETASSLISNRYPDLLSDVNISKIIRSLTSERVQGVLMVWDLWCGTTPVSSKLFSSTKRKKILGVDGFESIDIEKWVSYIQQDIREIERLIEVNRSFFTKNKFDGKTNFDVIMLSNVLNYIVGEGEEIWKGKISNILRRFVEEYLVKSLWSSGSIIIQNGDMSRRYAWLKEHQVNDYFSEAFEEVVQKFFQDSFYLWFAIREKKRIFGKNPVDIKDFQSHLEFQEIDGEQWMKIVRAGNIRCMKLK